jgi:7-carboxy-7-deazaguanine synthase
MDRAAARATISSMKVAELFHSIQGEGKLSGVPSVFVRASGCNLRCVWCDTPYASWDPEGEERSVSQIVDEVAQFKMRHVVVTGGEPMIMSDITELCHALKARNHHITIETAATVFKPLNIDLASLSPKLSNSTPRDSHFATMHEQHRMNIPVIQRFIDTAPDFQLKFVMSSQSDMDEISGILLQLKNWEPCDVQLMPEGTDPKTLDARAGWIADVCRRTGFRFCPRLHIALFGNTRGT